MATTRIYVDADLTNGKTFELPETAGHHVARVLRMRISDPLILFNGLGGEYGAKILSIHKSSVKVEVSFFSDIERESSLHIKLGQALSKGEKMDFTIQKAVELGVSSIVPLITSYSNVRLDEKRLQKKHEHWQKVIISACEQCGRNRIPELSPAMKLDHWLRNDQAELKLILVPDADQTLSDLNTKPQTISLIIGPEGGLSRSEIRDLENNNYSAIQLGPRILRTETAALATIAALQNQLGNY